MMGTRALSLGLALAVGAPLVATTADAAVVICQKKNKLKLRIDACTSKETQVDAAELGVTGPAGEPGTQGPEGPTNLVATVRAEADGTLGAAHAAAGITVTTSQPTPGSAFWLVNLAGTGAFTGLAYTDFIINTTCESNNFGVSNTYVDSFTLTADNVDIYVYCWVSDTREDSLSPIFVTVYKGD
jgi:hypothetical protein